MTYWQKDRNYRKMVNADGSVSHIITVDGTEVEVSAEVYRAYAQADRRERYCHESEAGLMLSLERMEDDRVPLGTLAVKRMEPAEDTALRQMLMEDALEALSCLTPGERFLIEKLFFEEVSARKLACMLGVQHRTVIYHRDKTLEKLRTLMGE